MRAGAEVSRDFIYEAIDKYLLLCLLISSRKGKVDNAKDLYETNWNSNVAPKPGLLSLKFHQDWYAEHGIVEEMWENNRKKPWTQGQLEMADGVLKIRLVWKVKHFKFMETCELKESKANIFSILTIIKMNLQLPIL